MAQAQATGADGEEEAMEHDEEADAAAVQGPEGA